MERIEVNVETGEISIIQLTDEEIASAQNQYDAWQAQQQIKTSDFSILDLQSQIATLTTQLTAIQAKIGA